MGALPMRPFRSVLVANRGEIAVRVLRAVREAGLVGIAIFSDADAGARHVAAADVATRIGPAEASASYLNAAAILAAAVATGAEAIHPGYGFLSERADFARAVIEAGLVWIGPPPDAIDAMGDKARSKRIMASAGVPVLPGWMGEDPGPDALRAAAVDVGFPLLVKAVAGGGGRGMRVVQAAAELDEAVASARREAGAAFGNGDVMLERYVLGGRHVEVQVLADGHGAVIHLGERECSLQRRHQKIIEEAPSVAVDAGLRAALGAAATAAARAVGYVGAGTVEFLLEGDGRFWFLEMNTRLQVEHPVTEEVWGVDLVQLQLCIAAGEPLELRQEELEPEGHAVEARIYAEDVAGGFLPCAGRVLRWEPEEGDGIRVDRGVGSGDEVTPFYDPMIGKVIAWAPTRGEALARLADAIERAPVLGVTTNQSLLVALLRDAEVGAGRFDTTWVERERERLVAPVPCPDGLRALAALLVSLPDPSVPPWSSRGAVEWPVEVEIGGAWVALRIRHERDGVYVVTAAGNAGAQGVTVSEVELGPGTVRACIDGVRRRGQRAQFADGLHLALPGYGQGRFLVPDPLLRAPKAEASDGILWAPMAGRVVRVFVEVGQAVAKGAPVLVLEAMKMEHPVLAAVAGVVVELRVAVGDQVAARTLLGRLDAADRS